MVYRVGHPPTGLLLENYLGPVKMQTARAAPGGSSNSRKRTQQRAEAAILSVGMDGLSRVGTVKRDRRSLEEIEAVSQHECLLSVGDGNADHLYLLVRKSFSLLFTSLPFRMFFVNPSSFCLGYLYRT